MAFQEPPNLSWWHTAVDIDTWDDLRFPASSINPAGQTGPAEIDVDADAFPGSLLFAATGSTMIAGLAQLPHEAKYGEGGVLRPHIHWAKTTSAAGAVVWAFYYRWIGNVGDVAGNWSSADNGTLAVSHANTANKHALTAFTELSLTDKRPSCMLAFKLLRLGGDSADDYGASARLFEIDFHFQRTAGRRGTLLEYPDIR
jgi:hypothetical protein